jgi:hypothetical protein
VNGPGTPNDPGSWAPLSAIIVIKPRDRGVVGDEFEFTVVPKAGPTRSDREEVIGLDIKAARYHRITCFWAEGMDSMSSFSADTDPGIESELIDLAGVHSPHCVTWTASRCVTHWGHAVEQTRQVRAAYRSSGGQAGERIEDGSTIGRPRVVPPLAVARL